MLPPFSLNECVEELIFELITKFVGNIDDDVPDDDVDDDVVVNLLVIAGVVDVVKLLLLLLILLLLVLLILLLLLLVLLLQRFIVSGILTLIDVCGEIVFVWSVVVWRWFVSFGLRLGIGWSMDGLRSLSLWIIVGEGVDDNSPLIGVGDLDRVKANACVCKYK